MQIQRGWGRMVRMQKTVSDQVVEMLAAAGVRRIYGMAGDALHPLMEALQRDSRIRWVHVRHEETAAFAASAEAQLTGELAVCCGSCGPGNMHLINGLYDASRSGAPVLALAAHIPMLDPADAAEALSFTRDAYGLSERFDVPFIAYNVSGEYSMVKAAAQARYMDVIEPELTPEEEAVFKRGRNANSPTMAKNASMADYRRATGFEALMGYLYLTGQDDRMLALIRKAMAGEGT